MRAPRAPSRKCNDPQHNQPLLNASIRARLVCVCVCAWVFGLVVRRVESSFSKTVEWCGRKTDDELGYGRDSIKLHACVANRSQKDMDECQCDATRRDARIHFNIPSALCLISSIRTKISIYVLWTL